MIMLFNQLLDIPHLSGGWIILAKEKCSLTWILKSHPIDYIKMMEAHNGASNAIIKQ
jgi:hypothetical protein